MLHPADTIRYNTAKIAEYQADARYDYNSQLQMSDVGLTDIIRQWLAHILRRLLRNAADETIYSLTGWILIGLIILIIALVVYFIWKKHPSLFTREKKMPGLPYDVEEENIYGVDFEKELSEALASNDFRSAVRIIYLQTLRFLADKEWIDWRIFKTPTEYLYELKPVVLRPAFRDFTNRFLQVRYGSYQATPELFDAMRELQRQIREGGKEHEGE
ncbi:DUF4129 domain-containing protein [Tannerella forsythia]|uniref:DUF4129 domain-containing protein n=1 Tax=Tannerella forsythia TaxID=28112 RepID=A0A3P1YMI5_TANFO|nr:DUF4129 domain-containing protein [Tannerella forsythia]RRD72241.1 DUF4129 domain-containing protein [Tannerella forsythia]